MTLVSSHQIAIYLSTLTTTTTDTHLDSSDAVRLERSDRERVEWDRAAGVAVVLVAKDEVVVRGDEQARLGSRGHRGHQPERRRTGSMVLGARQGSHHTNVGVSDQPQRLSGPFQAASEVCRAIFQGKQQLLARNKTTTYSFSNSFFFSYSCVKKLKVDIRIEGTNRHVEKGLNKYYEYMNFLFKVSYENYSSLFFFLRFLFNISIYKNTDQARRAHAGEQVHARLRGLLAEPAPAAHGQSGVAGVRGVRERPGQVSTVPESHRSGASRPSQRQR